MQWLAIAPALSFALALAISSVSSAVMRQNTTRTPPSLHIRNCLDEKVARLYGDDSVRRDEFRRGARGSSAPVPGVQRRPRGGLVSPASSSRHRAPRSGTPHRLLHDRRLGRRGAIRGWPRCDATGKRLAPQLLRVFDADRRRKWPKKDATSHGFPGHGHARQANAAHPCRRSARSGRAARSRAGARATRVGAARAQRGRVVCTDQRLTERVSLQSAGATHVLVPSNRDVAAHLPDDLYLLSSWSRELVKRRTILYHPREWY